MTTFKPPEELDFKDPKWDEWKQRFETYRMITELTKKDAKIQIGTLKYCMGPKSESILKTLNLTEDELKNYDTVISKFDSYFKPRRNEIRLRRNFHHRVQKENESLENFLTDLYSKAEDCKFSDIKERIRDQFLAGLRDENLLEKLELLYFTNSENFTIDVIMEYCRTYTDVKKSKTNVENSSDNEVNRVHRSKLADKTYECGYCGKSHTPRKCPAYNEKCGKCGRMNHFPSVCRTKKNL